VGTKSTYTLIWAEEINGQSGGPIASFFYSYDLSPVESQDYLDVYTLSKFTTLYAYYIFSGED